MEKEVPREHYTDKSTEENDGNGEDEKKGRIPRREGGDAKPAKCEWELTTACIGILIKDHLESLSCLDSRTNINITI